MKSFSPTIATVLQWSALFCLLLQNETYAFRKSSFQGTLCRNNRVKLIKTEPQSGRAKFNSSAGYSDIEESLYSKNTRLNEVDKRVNSVSTQRKLKDTVDGCKWPVGTTPTHRLDPGIGFAMNTSQFLTSVNGAFFLLLLDDGQVIIQTKDPSKCDSHNTHDTAIWGSDSGVTFGEEEHTLLLYIPIVNEENFITVGNVYVSDPDKNPLHEVTDYHDSGLGSPFFLVLLNTGELVLTGTGDSPDDGLQRFGQWQRPAHRLTELRHGDYWFQNGAYLVPNIDLPRQYTETYVKIDDKGDLVLTSGRDIDQYHPIYETNTITTGPKEGPTFRLLNGGIPERPGREAEGRPGRLYLYSDASDELALIPIGRDAQSGKSSNYVLTVEQEGAFADKMVMWYEPDDPTESKSVLWSYPN